MSRRLLPEARPGARRPGPWFALTALPLLVLFLPASVVLPGPLLSNGWPGRLLVFWVAGAVLLGWVRRPNAGGRPSPAEVACWVLLLGLVASLAAAQLREVSAEEAAGSLRVALVFLPLAVVALGVASLGDTRKIDVLLAGIVVGATFSAVVAVAQFLSPFDFAQLVRPPGMVVQGIGAMSDRGGFIRAQGSAGHPIEFGVLSGAVTPLAVHVARFAGTPLRRHMAAIATALLVVGVLVSVTRSGVLTLVVAMAVYAVVLNTRQRLNLAAFALAAMVLARAAVPGLLGTITGFFLGASGDDSVTARLDDYPRVDALFTQSPFIGRGLGTFLPDLYFLLDNQYLLFLIEGGLVLVAAFLAFIALTLSSARGAVLRADSAADQSRAQALTASVAAIAVSGFFFDLFSFAQVTVVLFLLVGLAGAAWRHGHDHGRPIPAPMERVRGAGAVAPARDLPVHRDQPVHR
ncbi:O-antigen ligase [Georgenia sp. SYP-B2076]|uniref:O-antigen ligase family protein n=1 Tax=Georgenia sp. SYP-B2076 TaxID=2495881 RepID=UPI000F8D7FCD|nr:O-antigen ligase family protein [Georgenia sp. SYP-B2076]